MNGILRYFYNKNHDYFTKDIHVFASSTLSSYYPTNSFNFGNNLYWNGDQNKLPYHFIGFCFADGCAKVTKYEMKCSNENWRPYKWSFSGSNDKNGAWENNKTETLKYESLGTHRFDWKHGPYKCFRMDCLKSTYGSVIPFDIVQLEIYGKYYPKCVGLDKTYNIVKQRINFVILHIILVIFSC